MNNYKNLLCPVDFSEISIHALQTAINLALRFRADLHVINVFQLPASAFPEGIYDAPEDMETKIEDQLLKRLDEFVDTINTQKTNITTGIYEGIPHVEIVRTADENNTDMIIIGTHGRTGLSQVFLGSVAERVIRTSSVPVLSVKI